MINCYMMTKPDIQKSIKQRKEDISLLAKRGSLMAISELTGVSRQTLYRWKRAGMEITLQSVIHRKQNPQQGLNGEKQRGPKLGSRRTRHLPGFNKRDRLRAKKDFKMAIADLTESISHLMISGSKNALQQEEYNLRLVTKGLTAILPPDFFLPIPTTFDPKKPKKKTKQKTAVFSNDRL